MVIVSKAGNAYHAQERLCWRFSDEILDTLLDQEGVEIEGLDRMEKDTPLHKAVRYVNGLGADDWNEGHRIVEILLDAGCDPRSVKFVWISQINLKCAYQQERIRNKAKLKPMDLVDPRNQKLRSLLQNAEFTFLAGNDVVQDDNNEGPTGSASDSDWT